MAELLYEVRTITDALDAMIGQAGVFQCHSCARSSRRLS
jgi:hypothetical protein